MEVKYIQFLVIARSLETVFGPDDARVRFELGSEIQRILSSDKVTVSGSFAGMRAGFFLINADAPEEIYTTLGRVILENYRTEVYPIVPFDKLGEVFASWE